MRSTFFDPYWFASEGPTLATSPRTRNPLIFDREALRASTQFALNVCLKETVSGTSILGTLDGLSGHCTGGCKTEGRCWHSGERIRKPTTDFGT